MYKNKIKEKKKKKGLTLREVAEMCGISVGYLSHLEKGSRDNPSKEVMENISQVLNKSIQEIFFSDWKLYYFFFFLIFNN